MVRPAQAAPAANTDSWLTKGLNSVTEWKNRTVTYLKNTDVYKFIGLAALSILVAVLTFDVALAALKHTVSVIVPVTIMVLYSQMLLLMANNIFQVRQAVQRANA